MKVDALYRLPQARVTMTRRNGETKIGMRENLLVEASSCGANPRPVALHGAHFEKRYDCVVLLAAK